VIAAGYDPALGARAMKRAVERELTQPAASRLAELSPDELTVVTVRSGGDSLAVSVQAPGWAPKLSLAERAAVPTADRLAAAWAALERIDAAVDAIRPKGAVSSGKVSHEHERYYALKELADAVGETLNGYEDRLDDEKRARLEGRQPSAVGRKSRYRAIKSHHYTRPDNPGGQPLRSIASAESMEQAIRELMEEAEPLPGDADLFEVENRLALLHLMATAAPDERPTYLWVRGFPEGAPSPQAHELGQRYLTAWREGLGVETEAASDLGEDKPDAVIAVKGIHARSLALTEVGTHLFIPKHGGLVPVRVDVLDALPPRLADPFAFGPILRVFTEGQPVMDVRTGLVSPLPPRLAESAETFRTFTMAALPRAT
jgi:hypothetical protein